MQTDVLDLKLNLGGRESRIPGFLNIDLTPGPNVDIISDVSSLKSVDNQSVSEIYVSHVLEHFHHTKTQDVLKEWLRVLKPGGKAYISVPDMKVISQLVLDFGWCDWLRNITYGDQTDEFAFHYNGFDYAFLAKELVTAGFSDVRKLLEMPFGINDRSKLIVSTTGQNFSLNVEATA